MAHDDAYNDLAVRLTSLEDNVMTNLPRIASSEYRMDSFAKRLANFEARLDREIQRRRLSSDIEETNAHANVQSHRGLGSVPPPSAPPKGAFTEALAKKTSPPSSVVIRAGVLLQAD